MKNRRRTIEKWSRRCLLLGLLILCTGCGRGEEVQPPAETDEKMQELLPFPEGKRIEEQCFETVFDSFGTVNFAAYAPNTEAHEMGDVVFGLESGGGMQYLFPSVMEGDRRPMQRFVQVREVCFQDYDEDGSKDVIIITEYLPLTDPSDDETLTEVRLYRSLQEQREFVLDTELMDALNRNQWNHTIQEVLDHLGEARRRVLLNYLTEKLSCLE